MKFKSVGDVGDEAEGQKNPIEVLLALLKVFFDPHSHPPHTPHIFLRTFRDFVLLVLFFDWFLGNFFDWTFFD